MLKSNHPSFVSPTLVTASPMYSLGYKSLLAKTPLPSICDLPIENMFFVRPGHEEIMLGLDLQSQGLHFAMRAIMGLNHI